MVDGLVKSLSTLSFRVEREIFIAQHAEDIRFLPSVEMTYWMNITFYEAIMIDFWETGILGQKSLNQNSS